jgi:predicted RNase H-like HicB family nuclease
MRKKEFTVIVEQDEEGYYVAEVPGLPGCHTQAKSLDTLMKRVKESIALCLDEKKAAEPKMHLVGVQRIAV